jgi:hypothetical protein
MRRRPIGQRPLAEAERERRAEQRQRSLAPPSLLYTRAQSAARLNCSTASIVRMEARGQIDIVRFCKNGTVYHRREQIDRLAGVTNP